ncbi:MAG: 2Fe-2S iron-sulfur cluster binding domain-containing protein [Rhodospirillales bacterium]|nr:2Fe-2S iron-sulfur cluster binding domain-containing protein [Rhodospirillales bacterium]
MELPAMTPEARAKIEHDAQARIAAGTAALAQAQNDYHHAMIANDTAAMATAMARQRTALGEMESGTAALRALAEGQPPRQIALTWFRDQMNLSPAAMPVEGAVGPLGISWLHLVSMAVVAAFALTMAAGAIARHRRSVALVNQLTRAAPATKAMPPIAEVPRVMAPAPPPEPPRSSAAPVRTKTWTGKLRVAAIVRETPHVKTFRLVEPTAGPIPFTFMPGQFLTFSTEADGRTIRRSYTIASPPTRNSYVEITVKREDEGEFSRFLHDKVSVGDTLRVSGPSGLFTFDGGGADSIVLIAGGVGITPMMCVIRHLTDQSWPGEIFLVFAMRSTEEFIFREELEYLQRRHPRLHVAATIGARSEGTSWMGLEGPIVKDTLVHAVPEIEKRRIHLCGPPPMMEAIRGLLKELGVPQDQIKTEAFGPATGLVPPSRPSPIPSPPAPVARLLEKVNTDAADLPPSAAPGPATAIVSFARSEKSAPMPPDKSVLEVAESIGVPIDYSCRVGTCGICKTKLLSGQVTMEVQDALTDQDKAAGIILACQAHALRDIAVDA